MEGVMEGVMEGAMEGVTEDCVHQAETAQTCFPLSMAELSVVGCIAFGSQDFPRGRSDGAETRHSHAHSSVSMLAGPRCM